MVAARPSTFVGQSCTVSHFTPFLRPVLVHLARLAVKSGDAPPDLPESRLSCLPAASMPACGLVHPIGCHFLRGARRLSSLLAGLLGKDDKLLFGMDAEFGINMLGMGVDGLGRDEERLADLFGGFSAGQGHHDVALALGELV